MKKLLLIIYSISLCGCGIWKSYSRPELETDNLFGTQFETKDSISLAQTGWEELFNDPYLRSLIERGLQANADLSIARLRINQAESALKMARAAFLPTLEVGADGALSTFDNRAATKTYDIGGAASWEIDIFGKLHNAKERTKAAYEQSFEYKLAVQTQLIANIANLYYTLLMLDRQIEITRHTAQAWGEMVVTMQLLKEAGMYNQAAVSQTESNFYATEVSLRDLQQAVTQVEKSISLILFETPQRIERGHLDNQQFTAEICYGVPLELLSARPDVRSAELDLIQAYYATNEARAALYPSLQLRGGAGWTNSGGGTIINPGRLLLSAAASLTQPILNRRMNRSQLEIARSRQQEAVIGFQQALLTAGSEVNDALTSIEAARDKRAMIEKQIAALETAVESTTLLMTHGSSTYLEILTARQALLTAQLAMVSNRHDEIQGVVSLYHALGGGSVR